jgi:histidyl-tRNA synthetase
LLSDLLAGMGIEPSFHAATFLALDKKGKIPDEEIRALLEAAGLDDGRIGRIFGILDIGSLDAAAQLLKAATPALDNMRRFEDILGAAGIRQAVKFDISVVRGLSYYTGIVFEAFDVNRQFRAIFGGGRYDNLLRDVGGKPATGVGLGFGDVVVAEILKDLDRLQRAADGSCTAVSYMEEGQQALAISVAAALRAGGRNVDLALRSEKPKAFFSRAGRGSFTEGIYIGPDDVARGTLRIKDLASRTEREVATADLLTPKRAS